jgi:manganese-dependent inorganic pyrophosphatase
MSKILTFGHKKPDTDSICSAIVMADIQRKMGADVEAVRLGEINKETEYALKYLNVESPRLIEEVEEGQEVILVDHNEFTQSVYGIERARIISVCDHHRIDNFKTVEPIFYYAEPVGCTGTILYKICKTNEIEIDKKDAGLMLSAIISDTLLLKSPTSTIADEKAVEELAKIAKIDVNEYGLNMLKAGTDLADVPAEKLIDMDAKNFDKNGINIVIAQVNTVSIEEVFERQNEIEKAIDNTIKEHNINLFVLAVTDILNSNSEILVLGDRADIIEKTNKLENHRAFLPGVVSRKKQLLPLVENNID